MTNELTPIAGYEGLYSIDREGNVFSVKKQKYLSQSSICSGGYRQVGLYKNGACKMYCIHKLVATTFIPNPDGCTIVDHIDGNKQNNRVDNLEWVTQKENVQRCIRKGEFSLMRRRKTKD